MELVPFQKHASLLQVSKNSSVVLFEQEKENKSSKLVSNQYACIFLQQKIPNTYSTINANVPLVLQKKSDVPGVGDGPKNDTNFCCTSSGVSFPKLVVGKAPIKQGTTQQLKQLAGLKNDTDLCCTSSGISFPKLVVGKALIKQGITQQLKQHADQRSDSIVETCLPQITGTVVEKEHNAKRYTRMDRAMLQKQEKDRRHRDSLLMERRGL